MPGFDVNCLYSSFFKFLNVINIPVNAKNIISNVNLYYKENYFNNNVFFFNKIKSSNIFILNSKNNFNNNKNIIRSQLIILNNKNINKFYSLNVFNLFFINLFNNTFSLIYNLRFFYSISSIMRYGFFHNIFILGKYKKYRKYRKYYPLFYLRFYYYLKPFFNFSIINLKLALNRFIFIYFFKYILQYSDNRTNVVINNLFFLLTKNKNFSLFYNFCYYLMSLNFILSSSLNKKVISKNYLYSKFIDVLKLKKKKKKILFSNIFSTFSFLTPKNFNFFYNKYYNLFCWSFFKALFQLNINFLTLTTIADVFSLFFNTFSFFVEKNTLRILFKRLYNFKISTIVINKYSVNLLRDFLLLRFRAWSVFQLKFIFFANKNTSSTTQWARRQVRRSLYALQNFIYHRFNKFTDAYDLPPILDFDKLYKTLNRNNNIIKYNGYLLNYIHWIKTQNPFFFKNKRKNIIKIITTNSIVFNKTEYLLSFYASNRVYKFFHKARGRFVSNFYAYKKKKSNFIPNKFSSKIFKNKILLKYYKSLNLKLKSIRKRFTFYSIKKRKTAFQKLFTLNLIHVMKYVKKKTSFCSFYKHRMLKIWKFRKFYGCLTDFELFSICRKAYKMHGDILHQFIMLLESRLDTILFRSGLVSSMFEARQFINHGNVLVNNSVVTRRSFIVQFNDFICLKPAIFLKLKNKIIARLNIEGLLVNPPVYLEINYNFFMIFFLHDILKASQVPFNFKLTGYDINNILYYYY